MFTMAHMENTLSGISHDKTNEQTPAARATILENSKILRLKPEYVRAIDKYKEIDHKNKEFGKNILDSDNSLSIIGDITQDLQQKTEELDSEIEKIQWSQNRAKLTLASQQTLQFGINQKLERHKAQLRKSGNEVDKTDEIFKRQELIENICTMEKELQEKKKETEENELQASQIEQENLIMRKRKQALHVRLGRQHQEAEFRRQQVLDKLTTLRERLKTDAANTGQENIDK